MESKEENVQPLDAEEVKLSQYRQRSIDEVHNSSTTRLYCGECNTECDYFGINPNKIMGFVCHHCFEFNDVDSDAKEEDRYLYATNNYATITGNIKEGRVWKLSPIAYRHNGKPLDVFAKDWKANRMFVLLTDEAIGGEDA